MDKINEANQKNNSEYGDLKKALKDIGIENLTSEEQEAVNARLKNVVQGLKESLNNRFEQELIIIGETFTKNMISFWHEKLKEQEDISKFMRKVILPNGEEKEFVNLPTNAMYYTDEKQLQDNKTKANTPAFSLNLSDKETALRLDLIAGDFNEGIGIEHTTINDIEPLYLYYVRDGETGVLNTYKLSKNALGNKEGKSLQKADKKLYKVTLTQSRVDSFMQGKLGDIILGKREEIRFESKESPKKISYYVQVDIEALSEITGFKHLSNEEKRLLDIVHSYANEDKYFITFRGLAEELTSKKMQKATVEKIKKLLSKISAIRVSIDYSQIPQRNRAQIFNKAIIAKRLINYNNIELETVSGQKAEGIYLLEPPPLLDIAKYTGHITDYNASLRRGYFKDNTASTYSQALWDKLIERIQKIMNPKNKKANPRILFSSIFADIGNPSRPTKLKMKVEIEAILKHLKDKNQIYNYSLDTKGITILKPIEKKSSKPT